MAEILRATSAAVESLLGSTTSSASNQSFSYRLKVPDKSGLKEIPLEEVLRRSQDEGVNLAEFLNSHRPPVESAAENTGHRGVSLSKSLLAGSLLNDESRHLVAPSTDSSEFVSIIDVGKSMTSLTSDTKSISNSLNSQRISSASGNSFRDVDLIPVRESKGNSSAQSSNRDTSGSTVSSLKTAEVVDASTPNSVRQAAAVPQSSINSSDTLKTPDLTEEPPALPPLQIPERALKQGSLSAPAVPREQTPPDIEVKSLGSSGSNTARKILQGSQAPQKRGAVAVHRANSQFQAPSTATSAPDQKSQIAAAVAAAVAATTPYHQLKAEIEAKLEKLTDELKKQTTTHQAGSVLVQHEESPPSGANDSLDITAVPETDDKENIGLPTPIHPRVAPQPHSHIKPADKINRPSLVKKPRVTAEYLRSKFEEPEEEQNSYKPELSHLTKENELIKKDLLEILKEARAAKREIEEIKHSERINRMKTTLRDETPADVYLQRIQERENLLSNPRHVVSEREYRTPSYILEAKNTLQEIEERRSAVDKKSYPLDSTYLCEELTPQEEEISKRISDILDNIQKEVKAKDTKNPKSRAVKTTDFVEPLKKKPKPKPRSKNKLEEKKALYNKLKEENRVKHIQANIGRLKEDEKILRSKSALFQNDKHTVAPVYESPYKRSGMPESFPLMPLPRDRNFPLAPPSLENQSTPMRPISKPISTQTSLVLRENPDVEQLPKTKDVSVHRASFAETQDQQCSPAKPMDRWLTVREPDQQLLPGYTPDRYYGEDQATGSFKDNSYIGVVDLPPSVTIAGVKKVVQPADRFSTELGRKKKPTSLFVPASTCDDNKESVMQWLEEAILEKLLMETPKETGAKEELEMILGEDVMTEISHLNLGLSLGQVHAVVTDIIGDQVEKRMARSSFEMAPRTVSISERKIPSIKSPDKSHEDVSKRTYDDSFENSTSTTSSKSSLSPAVTPTLSEESSRALSLVSETSSLTQHRSPVLTPPLSPDIVSVTGRSTPIGLPEGVPKQVKPIMESKPVRPPAFFNDTLEQVPLDLTDEVVADPVTVFTPDLTSAPHDTTLSLDPGTGPRDPMTPQNTIQEPLLDTSLLSQHTLDVTHQSVISQHPLELTGVVENIEIPPEHPQISSSSSPTVSYTETTDNPISAGEILPGALPHELRHQVFTGPLSEGEWPLSSSSTDLLQLVKDPEIKRLLEERVRATRSRNTHPPDDTIPEDMESPLRDEGNVAEVPARTLPPAPRRPSLTTPSPLPKTQSVENIETLELVTPLPDPDPDRIASPSPPPFMGLQLEDYDYSEGVTDSDKSDNSF